MLPTTIQLYDIDDVEGFVAATIERTGLDLQRDEKEELIAEGISILYYLAERFEPHRAGYAQAGCFSGYAARYLPRRLGDAWHRSHPEHSRVLCEDGKRHWVYREMPISLDEYLAPIGPEGAAGRELAIRPPSQQVPPPLASARRL